MALRAMTSRHAGLETQLLVKMWVLPVFSAHLAKAVMSFSTGTSTSVMLALARLAGRAFLFQSAHDLFAKSVVLLFQRFVLG